MLVPDVGGGFGIKGHVYPEEILVAAVARRLGRPVKWAETRREHFLTAAGDRDQVHEARIGLERDGAHHRHRDRVHPRSRRLSPTLGEAMTLNTINHLPGPYRVPHYRGAAPNVVTHKTFARRLSRRRPARGRLRAGPAAGSRRRARSAWIRPSSGAAT